MQPTGMSSNPITRFFLGGLFDQVNNTIDQAAQAFKNAGMELEIQAGQEIQMAIERAKQLYEKELDNTIDKVSKQAKISFDELDSIVQKFQVATQGDLDKLALQAQQLANSFKFSSKQSQLTSLKPRYLVVGDVAQASLVTFKGNFPCSSTPGFEPSFEFGGRKCVLVDKSTQTLTFQVPHDAFNVKNDQYTFTTGMLHAPWDDGLIWSNKKECSYQVGLGALPQIAGTGTVEYEAKVTQRHYDHKTTDEVVYNGNKYYPEKWHTVYAHINPKPGWLIDTSKPPILHVRKIHGDNSDHREEIISVSDTDITLKIGLYCKSGEDMGIVGVQVEFDQYLDQVADQKRTETFEVNWKDSRLLEPQGTEVISSVKFDDYKRTHQEFAGPDLTSSVLKIEAEGNGKWKIWAEPPRELQSDPVDMSLAFQKDLETVQRLQHLLKVSNLPKNYQWYLKDLRLSSSNNSKVATPAAPATTTSIQLLTASERIKLRLTETELPSERLKKLVSESRTTATT